jgi:probable rRNA maturation factor
MILIDNRQNKVEVTEEMEKVLMQVIDYTLKDEKVFVDYEVSLVYVDNEQIKEINKEFRSIDRETDVLSFPMLEYPAHKVFKNIYLNYEFDKSYYDEDCLVLGDIALSLEKAEEQRVEYNHSFIRETAYLVVHSILHLLGYDHMEEEDKTIMRQREEEILNSFNISREI